MHQVTGTVYQQVFIDNKNIADILKKEKGKLLGGSDHYIENGIIYYDYKYHTWQTDRIREATNEEIELDNALKIVIKHLNGH